MLFSSMSQCCKRFAHEKDIKTEKLSLSDRSGGGGIHLTLPIIRLSNQNHGQS